MVTSTIRLQHDYDTRLWRRIDVIFFDSSYSVVANHRAAGWYVKLVKMEQPIWPRLSDSVIENTIEYYHNERVLWDVNNMNFVKLEAKDAVRQR